MLAAMDLFSGGHNTLSVRPSLSWLIRPTKKCFLAVSAVDELGNPFSRTASP
jgi:hypothetical protein